MTIPTSQLEKIGETSRGYYIYREPNEAGGHRYWSDSIGGGVVIMDTCLQSIEELIFCINHELQERDKGAIAQRSSRAL
jgi:hypothetical protein